jgi:hypothetical protein
MFKRSQRDLEAQNSPGSSRDGGRLRNRVSHYQKDLRTLAKKKIPELTDLLEGLFWYQEFGSTTSSTSFDFAKHTSFRGSLTDLAQSLAEAGKSSTTSVQLW